MSQSKVNQLLITPVPIFGQCELVWISTSTIKLLPCDGDLLTINGRVYQIPSAGVSGSNSGLSSNTLYFVYAYMSSGTMTLEFSTTGRATDTTAGNVGVQIKSGDASRTLVGMTRMSGSNFAEVWTRSWFHDRGNYNWVAAGSNGTAAYSSWGSMVAVSIPMWAGEHCVVNASTIMWDNTAGTYIYLGIGVNSSSAPTGGYTFKNLAISGYWDHLSYHLTTMNASDGFQGFYALGQSGQNGTTTYSANSFISVLAPGRGKPA